MYTIIIVAILILIYMNSFSGYGFWIVSEEFKQDSGLDQLMIYIDKNSNGYIILSADSKTLFNDKVKFSINQRGYNTYSISMDKDVTGMPKSMIMAIYPNAGFMELKGYDNIVYGRLFKDNQMSNSVSIQ